MDRATFIAAYIEAAMFADTPEDAQGAELADVTRVELASKAGEFFDGNRSAIEMYAASSHGSNAGHDLWYTQNGHGCGYWEHDTYASARALDKAAKAMPQVDLYVGDDGYIHVG